jgi:large subunit ribosomal protein L29
VKAKDIRSYSVEQLQTELNTLKEELFNLRFQHATGQLENPLKLREVRRDYARVKTILREKELARKDA